MVPSASDPEDQEFPVRHHPIPAVVDHPPRRRNRDALGVGIVAVDTRAQTVQTETVLPVDQATLSTPHPSVSHWM